MIGQYMTCNLYSWWEVTPGIYYTVKHISITTVTSH